MNDDVTVTFSTKARNVLIVKIVLLVVISCLIGYYLTTDMSSKYRHSEEMTNAQYQKEFETYKAKQNQEPLSLGAGIIVSNIMIFFCFGLYETIGYGVGSLISKIGEKK